MKPLRIFIGIVSIAAATALFAGDAPVSLSGAQVDALKFMVGRIKGCPFFSLNYGANHPYDDGCVDALVDAADVIFKNFMEKPAKFSRNIKRITNCPQYSLNYGANHPYEDGCVKRLVESITDDLEDLKSK